MKKIYLISLFLSQLSFALVIKENNWQYLDDYSNEEQAQIDKYLDTISQCKDKNYAGEEFDANFEYTVEVVKTSNEEINKSLLDLYPGKEDYLGALKDFADLIKEHREENNEEFYTGFCNYSLIYKMNYLGNYKNYEIFESFYSFNALGSRYPGLDNKFMLDQNGKHLQIEDILQSKAKNSFYRKLIDLDLAHRIELKSDNREKRTIEEMEELLEDNFYLDEQGLTFDYPVYEVGSFADGTVHYTIPYKEIGKYLKPEFLP